MTINGIGLAAAIAAFLGIWWGHVLVRKIEAISPRLWVPISAALLLGLGLEGLSLAGHNLVLSAVSGILGMTVLWDALEFVRQEERIKKGHVAANPQNLRHARLLAEKYLANKD